MYEDVAFKFLQHFMWISYAMDRIGEHHDEMWDEQDGFFYDLLRLPGGQAQRLKVRSLVGLLPLCASTVFEGDVLTRHPRLMEMIALFRKRHPELVSQVAPTDEGYIGHKGRRLLSILNKEKLQRVLAYLLDENEFLGPHGVRSLSRYHKEHPFVFWVDRQEYRVEYLPAESNTGMFGGNSNWRGPVWMPVNALIIRALLNLYTFYGDDFTVECPTGSGRSMTLFDVAQELARRLSTTFLRDVNGQRPVYGGIAKFQEDPHWRDLILFHEYFHGDNGAGLGASHQTGWTGLVALLLDLFGRLDAKSVLETERGRPDRPAGQGAGGRGDGDGVKTSVGTRGWPTHPVIYEINTWTWLHDLGRKYATTPDLATVPAEEWDAIASHSCDAVWLMGVWERSPAGIAISMRNPGLLEDFRRALARLHGERQRRVAVLRAPLRRRCAPRRTRGLLPRARRWRRVGYASCSISCRTTSRPTIPGSTSIPSTSSTAPRTIWRAIPRRS